MSGEGGPIAPHGMNGSSATRQDGRFAAASQLGTHDVGNSIVVSRHESFPPPAASGNLSSPSYGAGNGSVEPSQERNTMPVPTSMGESGSASGPASGSGLSSESITGNLGESGGAGAEPALVSRSEPGSGPGGGMVTSSSVRDSGARNYTTTSQSTSQPLGQELLNGNTPPALQVGYQFQALPNPEDTWTSIWNEVRAALAVVGTTALNIRSIHKVDPTDKTSRWKRQQVVCKCAGHMRSRLKNEGDKMRKTNSFKTNCPFRVTVSWPKTGPPVVTQSDLFHNQECTAESRKRASEAGISPERLHTECAEDVRKWTMGGLRKTDMFRLLEARYAPLKLGDEGRRKVRNMAAKEDRQLAEEARLRDDEDRRRKEEAEAKMAARNGARAVPNAKLFNYLMGIARTEAERICCNLSTDLTPEKAAAVFRRLGPEVDALLMGSMFDDHNGHVQMPGNGEPAPNDAGRKHALQENGPGDASAKRAKSILSLER